MIIFIDGTVGLAEGIIDVTCLVIHDFNWKAFKDFLVDFQHAIKRIIHHSG